MIDSHLRAQLEQIARAPFDDRDLVTLTRGELRELLAAQVRAEDADDFFDDLDLSEDA